MRCPGLLRRGIQVRRGGTDGPRPCGVAWPPATVPPSARSWLPAQSGRALLLEHYVLPAPGEGPSPEEQLKGDFDLRFLGRTHGATPSRARDGRPRSGVRLHREDPGSGGGMPGKRCRKRAAGGRFLDTRDCLWRPPGRTPAAALGTHVRSDRQVNSGTPRHKGTTMPGTTEFLTPVLALIAWTLVMWVWMYATRIPAMQRAGIQPQEAAHPGNWTTACRNTPVRRRKLQPPARTADDLLRAHVLCGPDRGRRRPALMLAWGYVGIRIVHSLVQATINP